MSTQLADNGIDKDQPLREGGKPRLAPASPELRAAIAGLARTWKHDRRARPLLDAAARSRDADLVKAVNGASNK